MKSQRLLGIIAVIATIIIGSIAVSLMGELIGSVGSANSAIENIENSEDYN